MSGGRTVLIFDRGARGHEISRAYEKSPDVDKIVVAPGNDLIAYKREKEVVVEKECSLKDPESLLRIARKHSPYLVDVAQDDALAAGTVDLLQGRGYRVFGPLRGAMTLESDKIWSRRFQQRAGIPHPKFVAFEGPNAFSAAKKHVEDIYSKGEPTVFVKAAGLCAGKGALRARDLNEALAAISEMKNFGIAGRRFLIEESLHGEECSLFAISDGRSYRILGSAQDYKRALDNDEGDQTGSMGCTSPFNLANPQETDALFISRALERLRKESHPYTGVLYFSGMGSGCVEYNGRWGDTECQAVLPSIMSDYYQMINAAIDRQLENIKLERDSKARICVVGAAKGYPNDAAVEKVRGRQIFGLEEAMEVEGITVLGAGIAIKDGRFLADGGRLFNVVAEGTDIRQARERAYSAISKVRVEGDGLHYRSDIGWREFARLK